MSYQGATLGIMSSDTFKNRTQATKAVSGFSARFKSRGNNMDAIDAALHRWEATCNKSAVSSFDKTAMLMIIERECDSWLVRKRDKSSRIANFRRGTIQQLKTDAKKAAAYMRNKYYTEQKTQKQAHQLGGGRLPTKSLDGSYKLERQHYVQQGKTSYPYAAGAMHDAGKDLDSMSLAEYASADVARVYYHNRAERMQYMTVIEGGLFYDWEEKADCPVQDIWGVQTCIAGMYAVDKYSNLFVRPQTSPEDTFFNHSSFCAGKEVMCAGTIVFMSGALKYISTNSGHYKPAPPQLRTFLVSLAAEDVDLTDVCVFVKDASGARHLKAATFVADMRAATDWPSFDAKGHPVTGGGAPVSFEEPSG